MKLKLRGELTVAFVLLAVVPLLTVGAFSIWQSSRALHEQVSSSQRAIAALSAAETEQFLKSLTARLELLADTTDPSTATNEEIQQLLSRLIARSDDFSDAAFVDVDGQEVVRVSDAVPSAALALTDRSDDPAVRQALDTRSVALGDVEFDPDTGQPTLAVGAVILDRVDEQPLGVFTATLKLRPLWDRVSTISAEHGGQTYIIDSENRVIAHPNPSVVLRGTRFTPPATEGSSPGLEGTPAVISTSEILIGGQRFTLIAETPVSTAFASRDQAVWVTAAGVTIAMVMAAILALLSVRRIVSPIDRLGERAQRVRAGDLRPSPITMTGPAELRELTATFDETVRAIRERQLELDEQSAQLRRMNEQLEQSVIEAEELTKAERRTSLALTQREERLNAILDTAADAIIGIADDGSIEAFNIAAEAMFGYGANEIIGQSIELLMPTDASDTPNSIRHYLGTGRTTASGGRVRADQARRRDGIEFPIQLSVSEIREPDGRRSFTAIFSDMTEIRRAEAELAAQAAEARDFAEQAGQATTAKAQFLATMSHEIRTPMNGVIGMTGLLMDTPLSDEQREYATAIRSSGDVLLTLINDILDFSKIEAGKVEFEELPFSLRDSIYEITELLSHRNDASGLELIVDYPPDVPHQVIGDVGRVRQVLLNLGSNAIKFTPEGTVTITVSDLRPDPEGMHRLRIAVSDSGLGIPESRLSAIFDEFTQVDASTTRTHGGTGLGLAIVRELVQQMDGTITVDSVDGEGSTFAVEIPFKLQEPLDDRVAPPALASTRVLVAADRETSRRSLLRQLEAWGVEAVAPTDLTQIVRQLNETSTQPFDVVICDYRDLDAARQALERLRANVPTFDKLPIVLAVGVEDRSDASAIGNVVAVTIRPVAPSRLMNAIASAVGQQISTAPREPVASTPVADCNARVLIAEDNTVNQIVARKMLENLGCRVDVVGNGLEAVAAVAAVPYDIVFMDCQMPEMDGYEATRTIRNGSVRSDVPIVAMTANAMEGDRERCLEAGMDDYVAKPVTAKVLPPVLQRWANARGRSTAA